MCDNTFFKWFMSGWVYPLLVHLWTLPPWEKWCWHVQGTWVRSNMWCCIWSFICLCRWCALQLLKCNCSSAIVLVDLLQCNCIFFEVHDEVIERFRGATGGYMKKLEKGQHIELLSELINYNCEVRSTFVGKVIFFQKSRSDVWSRATWNHLVNTCSLARARALSWVSDCLPFFLLSMYILKHRWT